MHAFVCHVVGLDTQKQLDPCWIVVNIDFRTIARQKRQIRARVHAIGVARALVHRARHLL